MADGMCYLVIPAPNGIKGAQMEIVFSGKYAINSQTFGINFEVTVDEQQFICVISQEALQDINPNNAHHQAEQQFISNRSAFECIAEMKIRAGETSPITIASSDVSNLSI